MKVLTFDCYGTLLDTGFLYDYIGQVAKKNGINEIVAQNTFGSYEDRLMYGEEYIPYDELIKQVLEYCDLELSTDIFSMEYNNVIDIHKNFKPFPDVINNLKELKAKGYKLFLMSNSIHSIMKCNLNSLENVFDGVFTAEDTKCYKPNLKFFEYVEKHIGFDRSEHCHIAKGYWWDIVPCSKLGWRKIWINRQNKKGSNRHQPYLEVKNLNELGRVFK